VTRYTGRNLASIFDPSTGIENIC